MKHTEYRIVRNSGEVHADKARLGVGFIHPQSMDDLEDCLFDDHVTKDMTTEGVYETKEAACEALKAYKSEAREMRWSVPFYDIDIYTVEEVEVDVDEDGDTTEEWLGRWAEADWAKDLFQDDDEI